MGNSNRRRGDYFERQAKAALQAYGWIVVRAAGSLGPADLVALRDGAKPLLVACKLHGIMRPAERAALQEAADQAGARALLACRVKRGHVSLYRVSAARGVVPVDQLKVPPRVVAP